MNNQKAIDIIKTVIAQIEWEYPMDYAAAFDLVIKALKKQELKSQREDEAASDMRDYCEQYELTYNPEDGSM